MKNIQIILIIAILILIYLITMQWLWDSDSDTNEDNRRTPLVETQTPAIITPADTAVDITSEGVTPISDTSVDTTTQIDTTVATPVILPTTDTTSPTEETTPPVNPELIEYKNTNYGYHLSMPKQMYYAGFGARDGASHTLAIQPKMLPETFGDATVRVYYYGKKILPELKATTHYVDPNGKYILLLIDGQYSVRIESDNLKSATVQAIEATIGVD